MKKEVVVMLCFARSGGTLLNRCLGKLPNTIMLSEVNPESEWKTGINKISHQCREWFQIDMKESKFIDEFRQIKQWCDDHDKTLILRDFSYGSFVPRSYNDFNPSKTLMTMDSLINDGHSVRAFAFVRNAKDVWLSMYYSEKDFHDIDLKGYYAFVRLIKKNKIPIFKYEDFCINSDDVMKKICQYTGVEYSEDYKHYDTNQKVLGDVRTPDSSRALSKPSIEILDTRHITPKLKKEMMKKCKLINKINKMLGYQ